MKGRPKHRSHLRARSIESFIHTDNVAYAYVNKRTNKNMNISVKAFTMFFQVERVKDRKFSTGIVQHNYSS